MCRVNGLVPFTVAAAVIAVDVGRQRHVANRINRLLDASGGGARTDGETDEAASVFATSDELTLECDIVSLEEHARAHLQFLAWMHQRMPVLNRRVRFVPLRLSNQQALHRSS